MDEFCCAGRKVALFNVAHNKIYRPMYDYRTENDGYYRLAGGQCERLQTSVPEVQQHTIATLTNLLVAQENLLMTLMMND